MYSTRPGLILGFHGCDQSVVEKIINGSSNLNPSQNDYDWLGHGIYFWENSPSRALQFAKHLKSHPSKSKNPIHKPAVLGAVLDLGHCLDLLDFEKLDLLKSSYNFLQTILRDSDLPKNISVGNNNELMLRDLDCAVIDTLNKLRLQNNQTSFDSVKGVFSEGKELYPNAGFKEKDHIQICIRNPNCIKGFFKPRLLNNSFNQV